MHCVYSVHPYLLASAAGVHHVNQGYIHHYSKRRLLYEYLSCFNFVADWMWRDANRICHRIYRPAIGALRMLSNWPRTAPQPEASWNEGCLRHRSPPSKLLDQCRGRASGQRITARVRASTRLWVHHASAVVINLLNSKQGSDYFIWRAWSLRNNVCTQTSIQVLKKHFNGYTLSEEVINDTITRFRP